MRNSAARNKAAVNAAATDKGAGGGRDGPNPRLTVSHVRETSSVVDRLPRSTFQTPVVVLRELRHWALREVSP